ncbi:MAG: HEPN domain-containing protein [Candidatus Caldarchaeum sp.]|nr:HEPN domain-containing protein [Candidatus Caldarchaeum sp.]
MGRRSDVDVLRRRAVDFLELAENSRQEGKHDVACFLAEQAAQLYLKSALLKTIGDYSRTHSVRQLLKQLADAIHSEKLRDFSEEWNTVLSGLEDAYIMSRYTGKQYDERDAAEYVKVVRLLFKAVEEAAGV